MPGICIISGFHPSRNPRVVKEAQTLIQAGHEVDLLYPITNEGLFQEDQQLGVSWNAIPYCNLLENSPSTLAVKAIRKLALQATSSFDLQTHLTLGYNLHQALRLSQKKPYDIVIGHQEAGLWICFELRRLEKTVGVDFEDWYSQNLFPSSPNTIPFRLLQRMEHFLLDFAHYTTTTSHSLANTLSEYFDVPIPTVIYNSFPESSESSEPQQTPSLFWFSQTIGPDRGLETLFESLHSISSTCELHLLGNLPERYQSWLDSSVPTDWKQRLSIHPTIPPWELHREISRHHIGLALETPHCPNRDLTITNKLFQYMQAGLAIIATDTQGQEEILSQHPEIGLLIPSEKPQKLAQAITQLLEHPDQLEQYRQHSLRVFREKYCWEKQSPELLEAIEHAIKSSRRS